MTLKSMDVFSLREFVVDEYKKFATSFTSIHADDIRRQVEAIYASDRYWPEPLIQVNPSYRPAKNVDELAEQGLLDRVCATKPWLVLKLAGEPAEERLLRIDL